MGQWDSWTIGQLDDRIVGRWDNGTVGRWENGTTRPTKKSLIVSPSQSHVVPKSQSLILISFQNQPTREDTSYSHVTITAKKTVANTALGASNYLLMVVMLYYSITFSSDVRISALPIEVMFTSSAVPE